MSLFLSYNGHRMALFRFFRSKTTLKVLLGILAVACISIITSAIVVRSHYNHTFADTAQCGVIFGAAVWRDDIPSHALDDRIQAGINLYQNGNINCLILSGGPSTIGTHEVDVMKKIIMTEGINEQNLYTDYSGTNTQRTIQNLPPDIQSFVMISQDFHLARIRLIARRHSVPNVSLHAAPYLHGKLTKEPYFFTREVFGWLLYQFYMPSSPIDLPFF